MRVALGFIFATLLYSQDIRTVPVANGISAPTDIQHAGDGSGRLFLVQQNGLIRILKNGSVLPTPFLDIRSKTHADGERGLLGLAFPPGYSQSRRFYLNYTDLNGDTIIAQYQTTANPDVADAASEVVLTKILQPFPNHNGGQVRFGPDGYLYIGMGDGGSGGDPMGNGQNVGALLGKLLRVDPESSPGQLRVPPDNPFVNRAGARPEVWAYGLRNPWRFTFDRATRDLWIADVGQDTYEEVNFTPASSHGGENYGWNLMEGMHCFKSGCQTTGLVLPVAEYTHADGCSVSGGFVYRGNLSPGLRGIYLYGDYCSGRIWGIERQGSTFNNRLLLSTAFGITTFGEDEAGEMYLADASKGTIYRIEGSRAPRFGPAGVVNPASFASGMVAGSLATVFAAGVRVTVDGIAAPVYSLSNVNGQEQLSFQVPWAIAGRSQAALVIIRDGQASSAVNVPVIAIQPGVYASDGTQAI